MWIYYFLGFSGGVIFGWIQFRILCQVLKRQGLKRYSLLLLKVTLWSASMVLLALLSIAVLLCFVLGATVSMIVTAVRMRHHIGEV